MFDSSALSLLVAVAAAPANGEVQPRRRRFDQLETAMDDWIAQATLAV
jgi:hypothetical protein